jgi:hypothetical protein
MKLTRAPTDALDQAAIEWLLASDEPGIRMQARRDLLAEDASGDAARVLDGPLVKALLAGQQPDGGFGVNVYNKWKGAHWRLVSLIELGIAAGESHALTAYETVLKWMFNKSHRSNVPLIDGRYRRCASQEGNALAVGVRLGLATDPRIRLLAESLVDWQWPDGGWNCDRRPGARHSSFYESAVPLWGLSEYARETGDRKVMAAVDASSEFFLDHEVYKSHRTGEPGDPRWIGLAWPPYYAYDVLWGLTILQRAGALPDKRATDAVTYLRGRQLSDGTWADDGMWPWRVADMRHPDRDPARWPRSQSSEIVTLNALRALRAAEPS